MTRKLLGIAIAFTFAMGAGFAAAMPTGYVALSQTDNTWHDTHSGYPNVPRGLSAIRATFGEPCSSAARANQYFWIAADNGEPYTVRFHAKLGGAASSNLDNDVPGHIEHDHWSSSMLSGMWGYNCRYKRGSTVEYSAHAWGIAVDINSAHEAQGHACHTVPAGLARIWQQHRWAWGEAWQDCMHFQYATGY